MQGCSCVFRQAKGSSRAGGPGAGGGTSTFVCVGPGRVVLAPFSTGLLLLGCLHLLLLQLFMAAKGEEGGGGDRQGADDKGKDEGAVQVGLHGDGRNAAAARLHGPRLEVEDGQIGQRFDQDGMTSHARTGYLSHYAELLQRDDRACDSAKGSGGHPTGRQHYGQPQGANGAYDHEQHQRALAAHQAALASAGARPEITLATLPAQHINVSLLARANPERLRASQAIESTRQRLVNLLLTDSRTGGFVGALDGNHCFVERPVALQRPHAAAPWAEGSLGAGGARAVRLLQ